MSTRAGSCSWRAPAVDLVPVLAPDSDRKRQDDTYLSLGLSGDAARYADVVDIQAQRFQDDPQRYDPLSAPPLRRPAPPIRKSSYSPASVPNRADGRRAPTQSYVRSKPPRDVVDGYRSTFPSQGEMSPNVRAFRPDIALDVLRRLYSQ